MKIKLFFITAAVAALLLCSLQKANAQWATKGSNIYNTNTGNVGIGTSTPVNKLTVKTADAKWGMIHTNGTVNFRTYVGSNGGWLATKSTSPLYFATGLLTNTSIAQMTLLTNEIWVSAHSCHKQD